MSVRRPRRHREAGGRDRPTARRARRTQGEQLQEDVLLDELVHPDEVVAEEADVRRRAAERHEAEVPEEREGLPGAREQGLRRVVGDVGVGGAVAGLGLDEGVLLGGGHGGGCAGWMRM